MSFRDTTPPELDLPAEGVQLPCEVDWTFDGTGLAHDLCSE